MSIGRKMSPDKFNRIAAAVFALSIAISIALIVFGIVLSPMSATADEQRHLDKFILSAQGTQIESISPNIPRTPEEQAVRASMDKLATMEQKSKAERLIASQISGFKERQAQIEAQKEAERQAAEKAAAETEEKRAKAARQQAALDTTRQHYATVSGASGHTDLSEQTNGSPSPATPPQASSTINILGETIPFIDAYDATRAPEHGCGVWRGDDLVDDGQMCYFVGHNPGDFHNVMNLQNGNPVTVVDSNGNSRTYIVHDNFIVPQKTNYGSVIDRVEGRGESIAMQTCCGDGVSVRIVVAW